MYAPCSGNATRTDDPDRRGPTEAAIASGTGRDERLDDRRRRCHRSRGRARPGEDRRARARAVTKAVTYGLLAALLVIPAVVLLIAGMFRALTELYQGEVWASWLTLGGIFVAVGGFLWAKRNA